MALAINHLKGLGYSVEDVSAKCSYDLLASSFCGTELYVEVKGTTAGPATIVLTANEVTFMRSKAPATALVVVHGVKLKRDPICPSASGGTLVFVSPWHIEEHALTPLSFTYQVVA
jgi:hypothetical protein